MDARNLTLVGYLTWLLVGIPSFVWQSRHGGLSSTQGITWIVCYCAFVVVFGLATRDECSERQRIALIALETILALTCIAMQPSGIPGVLLVIIAGQLGAFPMPIALPWIAAQSIALGFLAVTSDALWIVLAYFAFQLFGAFSLRIAHQESKARQALAEANAELQVATGLLDIGSRSEERLRIARDLHDLLGHHLTALSLNLEVASHLAQGEAREHIEKSQAITKLLLTDVRDVVSRLRNHEPVDLTAALHALQNVIDRPSLTLDIGHEIAVSDPAIAQVALRAIQEIVTNAVRHSGARNLWLKLGTEDRMLAIAARDDGSGTDQVSFGNGLRGMRERVEQLRGTMEVASMRGRGFEVKVRIPLEASTA